MNNLFCLEQPRIRLGAFPTPLEPLSRLSKHVFHDRLYIKRDDLTGLGLGGNKTRSLEFLLGDAMQGGADIVITAGGLQSNLCALTAAACARVGLDCILVHNDIYPQTLAGNMLLNRLFGAEQRYIGKVDQDTRAKSMEHLAHELRLSGRRPYIIHNGASTPVGALGYVDAARELWLQSMDLGINIKHVGMVGAMGGTASGFVFGAALLEHPFHVHVISVEYSREELTQRMSDLCDGLKSLTGLRPKVPISEVMTVHEQYLGGGYAVPTPLSQTTLRDLAQLEGIVLENIYTSKTLGGILHLIREGIIKRDEAACYVHTGGVGSFFAQHIVLKP